jgi:lysophospholipase L1-like esterase
VRGPRALLLVVIALITVGGVLAGFLVGRWVTRDAYVQTVTAVLTTQNTPRTLYQELGQRVEDPPTMQAMAKLYGVPAGDRAALVRRLQTIVWVPGHRPAPFVGHLARAVSGDHLHVNALGFRDRRTGYLTKPGGTVRIFVTGGSLAWGSGASTQRATIAEQLEQRLRARGSYEVVNAAYPGWSTTHEKILIQQRLVDLRPDVIVMLSGGNDVHWALNDRDVRWHYNYTDDNALVLLNQLFRSSGRPDWVVPAPSAEGHLACAEVARLTARNVREAAFAAAHAGARVVFALQPTIVSTAKRLSARERTLRERQPRAHWDACYEALRERLGRLDAPSYRWLDLSRAFPEADEDTEIFIDRAHVADAGNRLLARDLADRVEWGAIAGGPAPR